MLQFSEALARHTSVPVAARDVQMPDLGILNMFLADDSVSDILVNGTSAIYIDRYGVLEDTGQHVDHHDTLVNIVQSIAAAVNMEWNTDDSVIDTRLPDGSRVNIVLPPVAIDGISIAIRKFPTQAITLESMARDGMVNPEVAAFLKACVSGRANVIVAGGTGSGKTTMLNALSAGIPPSERIVTIEDSAELRLQQRHVVRMEALRSREAGHDSGPTVRDLVRNALRMRPDRIIIGESRGAEAYDILQAMNTGHNGSMTTLHANTPRDAMSRLENMMLMAMPQMSIKMARQQIASAITLVIQMARSAEGKRYISYITEICGLEGDTLSMQDLLARLEPLQPAKYRWGQSLPRHKLISESAKAAGLVKI